jgi:DNA-3-methyladenine glycosylase
MYGPPGYAYVYFTYGMHWMLNVVTEIEGFPAAVLLRALWPLEGVSRMRRRRGRLPLADGPAKLCEALAVDERFNGRDLCERSSQLFIEKGVDLPDRFVSRGPRIGLHSVPEPWKSRPWRFRVSPEGIALFRTEERKQPN